MAQKLCQNQMKNARDKNKDSHDVQYSQEIKQFAMTLHYYSPKSYEFACNFLALPHPSSLCAWHASADCNPGYLTNGFNMIGAAAKKQTWMKVVLIVDAMTLHKGTVWDTTSRQYVGHVDYGMAVPEAPDELATKALVFLVVGMTGHFKHPICYVLQDKCTAIVQAQLIKDCISLLHGVDLQVLAVVIDGSFTNQSTAKHLCCKMKVSHIQPWFHHPHLPNYKVHVVLDICHMIKLMWNLLADCKVICSENNDHTEEIEWSYIEQLNQVQEDTGFSLAKKLKQVECLAALCRAYVEVLFGGSISCRFRVKGGSIGRVTW